MQQQTITVSSAPVVNVADVHGDLRLAGWERSEIMAKTDGDTLNLSAEKDIVSVSCEGDLILYLPRQSTLTIGQVAGDASLQALAGPVTLGPVSGDLTMNELGPVTLGLVSGDATLRKIGALNGEQVMGDFILRDGNGPCILEAVVCLTWLEAMPRSVNSMVR